MQIENLEEYSKFKAIISDFKNEHDGVYVNSGHSIYNDGDNFSRNVKTLKNCIWHGYISSGVSGGNCWGGENVSFYSDSVLDEMPHFTPLFSKICPNITFLQYKKIAGLVKEDSFTVREYYGNETTYTYFYLSIEELYKEIKNLNILIKLD